MDDALKPYLTADNEREREQHLDELPWDEVSHLFEQLGHGEDSGELEMRNYAFVP